MRDFFLTEIYARKVGWIIGHDKTMGERLVIDKTVKVSISLLVLNPCSSPTDVSDF